MDKITDAFTSRVEGSPPKVSHQRNKYSLDSSTIEETSSSGSMPPRESSLSGTLADRRQGAAPAPIIVTNQRGPVVAPRRVRMEGVDDGVSPLSPRQMYEAGRAGYQTASSTYSPTDEPSEYWQSANMQRASRTVDPFYTVPHDLQRREASPERKLGSPIKMAQRDETHASGPLPSALWSPFPFYFRGESFPSERKGQKDMFGQHGWLERTDADTGKGKKIGAGKKLGLIESIKKIAKDMATDFNQPSRRFTTADAKEIANATTHLAISLDPREQSLFDCELEYHLTDALNTYIISQFEKGRLSTEKLARINDTWIARGRPRVVAFRYDLETQLDLVAAHAPDFVFYGRRQGQPAEIAGLLHTLKVNARALRVRTFCQPDTVMAKWLIDSQSLFNLIGVGHAADAALKELAMVFRGCVDRETAAREREMEKGKGRMSHVPLHDCRHREEEDDKENDEDDDDDEQYFQGR
ncbi:hypothetical protein N3K66_006495 [Trichothecium roseum]|uniref:Uncharacterized protein n=1 Tax=Trichothecium roseum TaxID=47278 RepID=A0ACC0UX74_9HYPO|nr:hypothetical protein N3K66_006495 [Trichothecium roseum]